ncbi:hypothetical protein SAMN04489714_0139 [Schaalia radingae]|uniref:Virus ReqiPepy6 Gp37-like protein n=2 Tax=Schaalia radingae TaxID=131110 RepID=A0ABY0V4V4_9ACTO|nr:hypothetical protein SAMN04489714_0139 [Schaalia radingae]
MSAWTTHRQASFRVDLLTRRDMLRGRLRGVTGGNIEFTSTTRLRGSGQLNMVDRGQQVDWLSDRVRITYELASGEVLPLGVWLLAAPTMSMSVSGASRQVDLLSKLTVLDEDCVERAYSLPEKTLVTSVVEQLIRGAGEDRVAITHSVERTRGVLVWDAGTPKLTIINDLLQSINYWSLWVDGLGQFRVEPYVKPAQRPAAWRFTEGDASIHLPAWQRDQDLAGVPNKVVLVGQAEGDKPALTASALNEDPKSRFSYEARGRWVTHVETGVEATGQQVLDDLANRRLIDRSTPAASIEFQHLPVPLQPNDLVEFSSQGVVARAVVQKWGMSLDASALAKTTIREVVDL